MAEEQAEVRCPACRARYWVELEQLGSVVECGVCEREFTLAEEQADGDGNVDVTLAMEEGVGHAGLTISSYMRDHGVKGGVSLDQTDATRDVLVTDGGRKYAVGDMFARGGMGAILNCRDLNIRRNVAMKVMLNPERGESPQILRFIEEAQVTGQLEHPGIVPVYELGVDTGENVFYTMKFVRGQTLKDILGALSRGDPEAIAAFPLARLLSVFLRVCEAMGYAHHKNVVHRDLKPENIMIGAFGEVYVMDWGLAKVLGTVEDRAEERGSGAPQAGVSHARDDFDDEPVHTLDGAVMGTPHYMAPEQATGKVSELDQRADVYALGGILYEILSLRHAADGRNVMALLLRVATGKLTPLPVDADLEARPHCPNGRVPDSLAAVAMKALALEPQDRYATVKELQSDIERYQDGFATQAEQAGLGRQLGLLVRRHKGLVMAAALLFLAVSVGFVVSLAQWRKAVGAQAAEQAQRVRAETNERAAVAAKAETEKALADVRREDYANVIALADRKIADGEILQAEEMLWNTPKELRGWEWGRCLYLCHQELLTLGSRSSGGSGLAFSPDGMLLVRAAAGARGWDVTTGLECLKLDDSGSVCCAAFSPDGGRIAGGCYDTSVVLWDAASGARLTALAGHKAGVFAIAFSPDGTRIASAEKGPSDSVKDCDARVWDAATGHCLATLEGHSKGIMSVAFSPDGQRLVTTSWDGTVRIWEAQNGKELLRIGVFQGSSAVFSPDGASVCIGASLGIAGMWDATTGEKRVTFTGHTNGVGSISISADGTRVVTASADRTARIWDAKTGKELLCIKAQAPVYSAALAPNGRLLATGGSDGAVRLWDVTREAGTVAVSGCPAGFSDRHSRLITAYASIREWDAGTGRCLREVGQVGPVSACALSADGLRVVTGHSDGEAAIWDAQTGSRLFDLSGHSEHIWSVAFSPDGTRAVSSSDPAKNGEANTVFLWDATAGRRLFALTGHRKRVRSACFSPDGQRIITGSDDRTARIWDAASGKERFVFRLSGENAASVIVMAAAFSPDGRRVVTGHFDYSSNVAVIWDVRSGQQLRILNGHSAALVSVAFSPDGRRVFTTARDLSLRVWDAETGRELLALRYPGSSHPSLADVSPDGRSLAVHAGGGSTLVLNTLDWSMTREDLGALKLASYQTWLAENGMTKAPGQGQ